MKRLLNIHKNYLTICSWLYVKSASFKNEYAEAICILIGGLYLTVGLVDVSSAVINIPNGGFLNQASNGGGGSAAAGTAQIQINDSRLLCAAEALLQLTEGNLGALVMITAGIGTIIAVAFGGYRAAVSLLAVAVSGFILRSLVVIFFKTEGTGGSCQVNGATVTGLGPASS